MTLKGQRPVVHLPKGNYTHQTDAGDSRRAATCNSSATARRTRRNSIGSGVDPLIRVPGPTHATFRNFLVNAGNNAVGILVENCDQPGGRIFGEQLNTTGFEYGFVADGLKQTLRGTARRGAQRFAGDRRRAGHEVLGGALCGASSRHRHHQGGHPSVRRAARRPPLRARHLVRGGFLEPDEPDRAAASSPITAALWRPADPNHLDKTLDWEKDLRHSVAALQFDGFRGKLAFTLVSANGGTLRVKPPSPDLKLYLLGFLTNQTMDFGVGEARGSEGAGGGRAREAVRKTPPASMPSTASARPRRNSSARC